jgi:hypothetical protein
MYDDDLIKTVREAELMCISINNALLAGVKHYRKSDGKLLETAKDIIFALLTERDVFIQLPTKDDEE